MQFTGKEFLTRDFKVSSYQIDVKGFISIPSLLSLFQEMAWEHATINGFGYEHLKEHGFFWALSRVRVEIKSLPKWTEDFSLTTWPSGVEGPFALRDFQVRNSNGDILVGATTSWLIVDIKTRRPQRPDTFRERMPICDSFRATGTNSQRIIFPTGNPDLEYKTTSRVSDIDVNGHINNTKYAEWAINALPLDLYRNISIKELAINFLAEGFCNEEIGVRMVISPNNFHYLVFRESDFKALSCLYLNII